MLVGNMTDRRLKPGYYKHRARMNSLVAVPVLDGDVLQGVLVVDAQEQDAFFEKDRAILELFGREIVAVLRKARTYTQIQTSARGFKALYDISSELITTIKIDEIAGKLVGLMERLIQNDHCILFRVHGDGRFRILASKGYDPGKNATVDGDKSMLPWLSQGETKLFHIGDLKKQPARVLPFDLKGLRTFIALPLIHEQRVEAILTVGSRRPDAYDARSIELLKVLANLAAVSVANAWLHRRIEKMAHTDGLTGLYNHRHFQERLAEEFKRLDRYPGDLSFLLMDIDYFKKVNDTYGHPAGDAVLRRLAAILKSTLRSAADFPARYGGEEFAAVLVNTDQEAARKIAERLRKHVQSETFQTDAGPLKITLSIGVASYPLDATTRETLIERADQALYHAKRSGRNRCVRASEVPPVGDEGSANPPDPNMTAWDRP